MADSLYTGKWLRTPPLHRFMTYSPKRLSYGTVHMIFVNRKLRAELRLNYICYSGGSFVSGREKLEVNGQN